LSKKFHIIVFSIIFVSFSIVFLELWAGYDFIFWLIVDGKYLTESEMKNISNSSSIGRLFLERYSLDFGELGVDRINNVVLYQSTDEHNNRLNLEIHFNWTEEIEKYRITCYDSETNEVNFINHDFELYLQNEECLK